MYQAMAHAYGAPTGPGGWQHDLPKHEHYHLGDFRKKSEAIAAADACPCHAVVVRRFMSEVLHDNGKPPHTNPFEARRLWRRAI